MNFCRYDIFATLYMKPGRNAWRLVLEQNDMFCQINISLTQKRTGLKFSGPGLRIVVIYMRTVRTQTGTRISHLGPASETKSDRSEFIVRPVSCERLKRNVRRSIRTHAGLSSSRSQCKYPLAHQLHGQKFGSRMRTDGFRLTKYGRKALSVICMGKNYYPWV